jgi:N-glycosidase YbiA
MAVLYYHKIDLSNYFQQYGYDPKADYALFYGNKGQDAFGNFYRLKEPIIYDGVTADNTEALYHSAKFIDPEIKARFNGVSPMASFIMSRKLKQHIKPDWHQIKYGIMLEICRLKYAVYEMRLVLMSTGSKYLVEHCPIKHRDNYWSDDSDGTGQNMLGRVLMQIRSEYFETGIVPPSPGYISYLANR